LPRPLYLSFESETEGDEYVARLEALLDRGIVPEEFKETRFSTINRNPKAYLFAILGAEYLLKLLPKGYASYTDADKAAVKAAGGTAKEDEERDRRLEKGEEKAIRAILAGAKPKGRQRALELREADSLVLLFDMALESAMRMREMFTLEKGQVDLRRHTIFLEKTKNGDRRQVPITTVLAAQLKPHMKGAEPKALLFPWWNGDRDPKVLDRVTSQLSRQYDRIFDAAGAADLHFHDLRHEATSRIYERTNLSDLEVAKITGHRDLRTLKRYANLRASTLAKRLW